VSASDIRAVRLVGAAIAAISGPVVITALFITWYGRSAVCPFGFCPGIVRSGWSSLGAGKALVLGAGILGPLALVAEWLPGHVRRSLQAVVGLLGLAAGLVVVHQIAGRSALGPLPINVPGQLGSRMLAGPWITLVGCLGIAGGSLLAAIGSRFFEPGPAARPAVAAIWLACLVALVTLWLPWLGPPQGFLVEFGATGLGSAWQALHTLATLLLLGLLATAAGAAIAGWFRWRAAFLALAGAGWLLAVFAAVGELRPTTVAAGASPSHRYGYWLFLACAAAIVLTGVAAASAGE
jgi:hypothetical protein